jgi:hypothetical protein
LLGKANTVLRNGRAELELASQAEYIERQGIETSGLTRQAGEPKARKQLRQQLQLLKLLYARQPESHSTVTAAPAASVTAERGKGHVHCQQPRMPQLQPNLHRLQSQPHHYILATSDPTTTILHQRKLHHGNVSTGSDDMEPHAWQHGELIRSHSTAS